MIRCCESCAKKLENPNSDGSRGYLVTPDGGRLNGLCPLCFTSTVTQRYEITPRRVRYPRSQSGGGERKRAGR